MIDLTPSQFQASGRAVIRVPLAEEGTPFPNGAPPQPDEPVW